METLSVLMLLVLSSVNINVLVSLRKHQDSNLVLAYFPVFTYFTQSNTQLTSSALFQSTHADVRHLSSKEHTTAVLVDSCSCFQSHWYAYHYMLCLGQTSTIIDLFVL